MKWGAHCRLPDLTSDDHRSKHQSSLPSIPPGARDRGRLVGDGEECRDGLRRRGLPWPPLRRARLCRRGHEDQGLPCQDSRSLAFFSSSLSSIISWSRHSSVTRGREPSNAWRRVNFLVSYLFSPYWTRSWAEGPWWVLFRRVFLGRCGFGATTKPISWNRLQRESLSPLSH